MRLIITENICDQRIDDFDVNARILDDERHDVMYFLDDAFLVGPEASGATLKDMLLYTQQLDDSCDFWIVRTDDRGSDWFDGASNSDVGQFLFRMGLDDFFQLIVDLEEWGTL